MQKQLQEERLQRAQARAQAKIKKKVGEVALRSHCLGRDSGLGGVRGPATKPGSSPSLMLLGGFWAHESKAKVDQGQLPRCPSELPSLPLEALLPRSCQPSYTYS